MNKKLFALASVLLSGAALFAQDAAAASSGSSLKYFAAALVLFISSNLQEMP